MSATETTSSETKDLRLTARVMVSALATGHVAFHWII